MSEQALSKHRVLTEYIQYDSNAMRVKLITYECFQVYELHV